MKTNKTVCIDPEVLKLLKESRLNASEIAENAFRIALKMEAEKSEIELNKPQPVPVKNYKDWQFCREKDSELADMVWAKSKPKGFLAQRNYEGMISIFESLLKLKEIPPATPQEKAF